MHVRFAFEKTSVTENPRLDHHVSYLLGTCRYVVNSTLPSSALTTCSGQEQ